MAIYDRGDVVKVSQQSSAGKIHTEYFVVLSRMPFNRIGRSLVAPIVFGDFDFSSITSFVVPVQIKCRSAVPAYILIHGVKMLDLNSPNSAKVEAAPNDVLDDVLARLQAVID